MIDKLQKKINALRNPSVIGIDTDFSYLPDDMTANVTNLREAALAIKDFNFAIIEKICKIVPAVKVQVAYYEQYGYYGMKTFYETLKQANKKGLIVISDCKRNDIGATAEAYSRGYLSGVNIGGNLAAGFPSDFITVNGYLGGDGILPFVKDCETYGKGIFVLVKTSNKGSGEFQDRLFEGGITLYEAMADKVSEWGRTTIGKCGYSSVGAVVGATHPQQAAALRARMPHTFFLVPGYGAQGGKAADIKVCFDAKGGGAIVNSSRAILCAYKSDKYRGMKYDDAAYAAAVDMQKDIDLF